MTHDVNVRYTNTADNTDPNTLTIHYTLPTSAPPPDTTPPETTIQSGPSGTVTETSASFSFTSSESDTSCQYPLHLSTSTTCISPTSYSRLAAGTHAFEIRATDTAGNTNTRPS